MAYADKEREKEFKRIWRLANQDKVKAAQERYNEKRRRERLDPEFRAQEAARKRQRRRNMTDEEFAAHEALMLERKRECRRLWARAHSEGRYGRIKARMEADPEYAAKMREQWKRHNAKRNRNADETPEQRERRLQRNREYNAKRYREKKLMEQLIPAEKKVTPKVTAPPPPPPKPKLPTVRKMGRFAALSKWHGL